MKFIVDYIEDGLEQSGLPAFFQNVRTRKQKIKQPMLKGEKGETEELVIRVIC